MIIVLKKKFLGHGGFERFLLSLGFERSEALTGKGLNNVNIRFCATLKINSGERNKRINRSKNTWDKV